MDDPFFVEAERTSEKLSYQFPPTKASEGAVVRDFEESIKTNT